MRRARDHRQTRLGWPSDCLHSKIIKHTQKATKLVQFNSFAVASLLLIVASLQASLACNQVHFEARHLNNIACHCNETNCAPANNHRQLLEFSWPTDGSSVVRVVSSKSGARFRVDQFRPQRVSVDNRRRPLVAALEANKDHLKDATTVDRIVELNINEHQQEVAGYGGALTDSASMLAGSKLPVSLRQHFVESYFGSKGLDYNLARVPIGGTDMSWRPYSCNDLDDQQADDFQLEHFRLQREDLEFKLPLIREINELRHREQRREPLKLLASSWSAPNWMKTGNSLVQGQLKGASDGPYYEAYARYLIRFIEEYERELRNQTSELFPAARNIWALTPQNEPCTPGRLGHSIVNYNSVNFTPKQMADFLAVHLIPQLLRSGRHAHELALFVWDDTLLGLDEYKRELFNSSGVYSFVRGLALHWYSQGLDKLPYKSLYETRRWLPRKFSMLSTEASFISRPRPGDWSRGVKYARDIIENLRAGAIGWIDWNVALSMQGGPTWSRNFLDAAVLIDEHSRELYKNPMYYAIGHVSRFLKSGARIISSSVYEQDDENARRRRRIGGETGGWKMIDEDEEQTSEILVAAAENNEELTRQGNANTANGGTFWRQIGLVLLNRSNAKLRTQLNLVNCKSELGAKGPLLIELEPDSITSLAFNC